MGDDGDAAAVMVPVSSTVIPLDEVPELTVGFGFGLNKDEKVQKQACRSRFQCGRLTPERFQVQKPSNLKDIQLITAKNQHRFVAAAGVQELTKEEFEQFNLSK